MTHPSSRSAARQSGAQRSSGANPRRIVGIHEIAPVEALFLVEGKVVELREITRNSAQLRLDFHEQLIELTVHQRWVISRGDSLRVAVYAEETGKLIGLAYRNQTQNIHGWCWESGNAEAINQHHEEIASARLSQQPHNPLPKIKKRIGIVLMVIGGLVCISDPVSGVLLAGAGLAVMRLPLFRRAVAHPPEQNPVDRWKRFNDHFETTLAQAAAASRARAALYESARRLVDAR